MISYSSPVFCSEICLSLVFFNTSNTKAPLPGPICNFHWGICCFIYTWVHITYKRYATYIYFCICFKVGIFISLQVFLYYIYYFKLLDKFSLCTLYYKMWGNKNKFSFWIITRLFIFDNKVDVSQGQEEHSAGFISICAMTS